jgi:hypothetical protein
MFRVRWEEGALEELAEVWLRADSARRQDITNATHQIDEQLRNNALEAGESRPEQRRVFFFYPLGVSFRVEQDRYTASVLHVWQFQRRSH